MSTILATPPTIDITIKYGLVNTGSFGTYIRPYDPHWNPHKRAYTKTHSSSCGNKLPSNTSCTLAFPQLSYKLRETRLLPGLSQRSLASILKLCDAGCKSIFYEQIVNITRKGNSIPKVWRDHKTGLWSLPLHNQRTGKQNLYVEPTNQENNVFQTNNYHT